AGHEGGELVDVRTKARRSDGAYVEISHIFGKVGFLAGENARRISLPIGVQLEVYDSIRGVTKWNTMSSPDRTRQEPMLSSAPAGCVGPNEQSVGKETVMGQETVAVLWPAAGDNKLTEWR